jgi:hypothetical protein
MPKVIFGGTLTSESAFGLHATLLLFFAVVFVIPHHCLELLFHSCAEMLKS